MTLMGFSTRNIQFLTALFLQMFVKEHFLLQLFQVRNLFSLPNVTTS